MQIRAVVNEDESKFMKDFYLVTFLFILSHAILVLVTFTNTLSLM